MPHAAGQVSRTLPRSILNAVLLMQIYNGLGLLLVSLHPRFSFHRFAGPAIAVGSLLFSGSIMTLVLARDR